MKVNLQYFGGRGASSKGGRSSGGIPKKWDTHEKRIIAMADLKKESANLARQSLKMTRNKSGSESDIAKIRKKRDKVHAELEKVRGLHNRIEADKLRKEARKAGFKRVEDYKIHQKVEAQERFAAMKNFSAESMRRERSYWGNNSNLKKQAKKYYGG